MGRWAERMKPQKTKKVMATQCSPSVCKQDDYISLYKLILRYVKKGVPPRGQRIANGEGFYVDILAELMKQLNFTGEYVPTSGPKEKWGSKGKNGTWNGMVGMLERGGLHAVSELWLG